MVPVFEWRNINRYFGERETRNVQKELRIGKGGGGRRDRATYSEQLEWVIGKGEWIEEGAANGGKRLGTPFANSGID